MGGVITNVLSMAREVPESAAASSPNKTSWT
jgi:hypothetical protein